MVFYVFFYNTQNCFNLFQMPVLVQQNSTQGVQLILRPPVASNTPGLLIHNARQQPQIHQVVFSFIIFIKTKVQIQR